MTKEPHFQRVALIGIGLIGSSLARVIRREGLADAVVATSRSAETRRRAGELGIVDEVVDSAEAAVTGADLVVICVPVGAYGAVAQAIAPHLRDGAIVTDVGSVKGAVIAALTPHMPPGVHLVPGHPIAGTEHSGPEAGFDSLFEGRWCVLTPPEGTDQGAVDKVAALWARAGSLVDVMDAAHHDMVLAITSHIPHLIAYNIVGTVADLEDLTKREAIKYAAAGFRDFTRIAASDPVMWRDIFLNNKDAVLEMLGRFNEDLAALQRAIRWDDGEALERMFARTRAIRRGVIEVDQA
jgi:cyclohexadieny/prephenate dehydrogenase